MFLTPVQSSIFFKSDPRHLLAWVSHLIPTCLSFLSVKWGHTGDRKSKPLQHLCPRKPHDFCRVELDTTEQHRLLARHCAMCWGIQRKSLTLASAQGSQVSCSLPSPLPFIGELLGLDMVLPFDIYLVRPGNESLIKTGGHARERKTNKPQPFLCTGESSGTKKSPNCPCPWAAYLLRCAKGKGTKDSFRAQRNQGR